MTAIIIVFGVLFRFAGLVLFGRIRSCETEGTLEEELSCSVIIPARNEANRIGDLLKSLKRQSIPPNEVIVADDDSTDGTAEIAQNSGARVIRVMHKPSDWTGKTWACMTAAQKAKGKLLLFLDADTRLEPDGLRRILLTYKRYGGMVSVLPFHRMKHLWERLSAVFNAAIPAGVRAFSIPQPRRGPSGAFGPCIICTTTDYFKCGGHASVRRHVLENLALGNIFRQNGLRVTCLMGGGVLWFRMYSEGPREMIEGWTKGFASGAGMLDISGLLLVIAWISGAFTTVTGLIYACITRSRKLLVSALCLYALYVLQFRGILKRLGNYGLLAPLLFPVLILFFTIVFTRSVISRRVTKSVRWRGRKMQPG